MADPKVPHTKKSPERASHATPFPCAKFVEIPMFCQTHAPSAALRLTKKALPPPFELATLPWPKSDVPAKYPVTATCPVVLLAVTLKHGLNPVNRLSHTYAPLLVNFRTKPDPKCDPPPKSMLP